MMARRRFTSSVALVVALWASTAFSATDGIDVSSRLEPSVVDVGMPITLVVEITRPRGVRIDIPGAIPDKPVLRVTGDAARDVEEFPIVENEPPRVRERIRFPFMVLDTDDVVTPEFFLTDEFGEKYVIPSISIPVRPIENETDGGVTEPAMAPARQHHVFTVRDDRPAAAAFAFFFPLGMLAIVHRWRRRRSTILPDKLVSPIPLPQKPRPDDEAIRRLEALLARNLLARGEVEAFVTALMDDVLRYYLENRYDLAASRHTTTELASSMLRLSAPGLDVGMLQAILEQADLVKFARQDLAVESAHAMANRVRAFVEATRPKAEAVT